MSTNRTGGSSGGTASQDIDRAPMRAYLDAVFNGAEGRIHTANGTAQRVGGEIKHPDFQGKHFAWPAEADAAIDRLTELAANQDVWVCPYLMWAGKRAKGAAVARWVIHADVDRDDLDLDKVRALGGFAVASGTAGHVHVYIPLARSVHAKDHRQLCEALRDHLGGDSKISDNDLLRPPGTLNHKQTVAGGEPTAVRWLIEPDGARVDVHTLAAMLGETHSESVSSPVDDSQAGIDLDRYPNVKAALAKTTLKDDGTPDRSVDHHRVVAACYDADLTLEQTRWVVNTRADLRARLDDRTDDDVQSSWRKVDQDRREKRQADADHPIDTPGDAGTEIEHTAHLGMAKRLGQQYEGKLLYVNKRGWHKWDGKRYAPDETGHARRSVHALLKRERQAAAKIKNQKARDQYLNAIARMETSNAIAGILTEAAALTEFSVAISEIDADPWLVNCQNGTLDLRTVELHEHRQADRITKLANASYRPDEPGGTAWRAFLEAILPDEEVRSYAQRMTGLGLLGKVTGDGQIMPIFTGTGANGKTTFLEGVAFALGDYAMTAEPTLLMAKRNDAHPTGIADLLGKRFVSVVETEQGRRFDITVLKWLTGGDRLKARFMRQDFFEFAPSHLLVLATNHLPRIDDDSEAVWRRVRVIPFDVQIAPEDRDTSLGDRLQAEADAVFTWVVQGWNEYREREGLDAPDKVLAATKNYKKDSDPVGRFIEDECRIDGALSKAKTKALYDRWEQWAKRDGCLPLSMIAFGRKLDEKGYPADKGHDRWRNRIALRKDESAGEQ